MQDPEVQTQATRLVHNLNCGTVGQLHLWTVACTNGICDVCKLAASMLLSAGVSDSHLEIRRTFLAPPLSVLSCPHHGRRAALVPGVLVAAVALGRRCLRAGRVSNGLVDVATRRLHRTFTASVGTAEPQHERQTTGSAVPRSGQRQLHYCRWKPQGRARGLCQPTTHSIATCCAE